MSGIIKDNEGRSSGLVKSTTVTAYDDDKVQSNIALLGFKTAVNGSLAKYNLQDQIIDEYEDNSGIDTGNSTNDYLSGGVYYGATTGTPTRTATNAETPIVDGDYTVYKWHSTGSYSANASETDVEWLVVAAGGSGGASNHGGGGGAGGLRTSYGSTSGGGASAESDLSLGSGTTYTITVGAGVTNDSGGVSSITGSDIDNITTVGGGAGGRHGVSLGSVGGSGGGGGYTDGAAGTAEEGYAGGDGGGSARYGGGGGGGASAVGTDGSGSAAGVGGAGLAVSITGSSVTYAGGGGGSMYLSGTPGAGGAGGGGAGSIGEGAAGTANTGGGGGGSERSGTDGSAFANAGGLGGSGIVILRVSTDATISGSDLTLQSTDTTASTANPDYADMVCLIEDAEGTATLNTDIKGWISEDSGSTFTQGTFVDEGSWGTNKKIVAFHDLDISAQSGSSMCYKITTHNQSAGSKETKIHATSIGWKA